MALSEVSESSAAVSNSMTIPTRLQSVTYATDDVRLFEFASLNGPLPLGDAGAHIDVHLPEKRLRQYSLITPLSSSKSVVIAVKREPSGRGGSVFLHDTARVGSEISISPPRNNFELDENASETLLLAGGIGITPIYSMFVRLLQLGRPVRLHYWCRSEAHALFRDELKHHANTATIHSAEPSRPSVAEIIKSAGPQTEIYCCGPTRMLDASAQGVADPARLHIERFGGEAIKPSGDAAGAFTVHLARKGIDVPIAPEQTILEVLLALGVDVPYSCEEGICGACETKVISGSPSHCDRVRSADESNRRQTMMICCSRCFDGRLVLDI
ncbi:MULTISPECIES: PDR/VanB family oxidoreductase [unclassified Hyphomicrobium]|uniref:PDR/VanB family oxidoreductase n=1 Tax=unclassified Hyphomicrobium TaxID=2619925 RepID=UPI000213F498|nr:MULTISPECIES: PDR/VanB family oxidoreductase [unclassified Hyphomicrobium]CCB66746.1 Phenoxybenzoate dioxygenase subunit beta [Hyphomicrobium sp. MC1]